MAARSSSSLSGMSVERLRYTSAACSGLVCASSAPMRSDSGITLGLRRSRALSSLRLSSSTSASCLAAPLVQVGQPQRGLGVIGVLAEHVLEQLRALLFALRLEQQARGLERAARCARPGDRARRAWRSPPRAARSSSPFSL